MTPEKSASRPSAIFQSEVVVHCVVEFLLAAKITLRCAFHLNWNGDGTDVLSFAHRPYQPDCRSTYLGNASLCFGT